MYLVVIMAENTCFFLRMKFFPVFFWLFNDLHDVFFLNVSDSSFVPKPWRARGDCATDSRQKTTTCFSGANQVHVSPSCVWLKVSWIPLQLAGTSFMSLMAHNMIDRAVRDRHLCLQCRHSKPNSAEWTSPWNWIYCQSDMCGLNRRMKWTKLMSS